MSVEITLTTLFDKEKTVKINNVTLKKYRALCSIHGKENVTILLQGE